LNKTQPPEMFSISRNREPLRMKAVQTGQQLANSRPTLQAKSNLQGRQFMPERRPASPHEPPRSGWSLRSWLVAIAVLAILAAAVGYFIVGDRRHVDTTQTLPQEIGPQEEPTPVVPPTPATPAPSPLPDTPAQPPRPVQ
jgi:hypothetical protein